MKGSKKKKPRGMKHKIREEKKKEQRIAYAFTVAILIAIICISGFIINSMPNQPSNNQTVNPTSQPKAAIVDHLSLTVPNQTFIQTATNTLKQAGYMVDYYPGEKVTVEFYRNLPAHGYRLMILRVHSTTGGQPTVSLFTSEPYSKSKYVGEQLTDRLVPVAYSLEEAKKDIGYFGITPLFVESNMRGRFANTTIVMMGCEGLNNTKMAEAFVEKGAKVYVSWNGAVLASHTDQATTQLLKHLVTEKQTIKQAVTETMKEVGLDPIHNSVLLHYPVEAENYVIPNPQAKPIVNST